MTIALLNDRRLHYTDCQVLGTPRRIVVSIKNLASQQEDQTSLIKGPPARVAFDPSGNPTKAAIGFAHGKGIPVDAACPNHRWR